MTARPRHRQCAGRLSRLRHAGRDSLAAVGAVDNAWHVGPADPHVPELPIGRFGQGLEIKSPAAALGPGPGKPVERGLQPGPPDGGVMVALRGFV